MNARRKTAIITGSSGFIGAHLLNLLLSREYYIHCLDIAPSTTATRNHKHVTSHVVDCGDLRALRDLSIWTKVDHVFHLAGVTQRTNIAEFRNGNVLPTSNLLRLLVENGAKIDRFVYISSQAAAGPAQSLNKPQTEQNSPEPIEAYGQSKLEAEEVVKAYAEVIPHTIIRPAAVYGPGDRDFLNAFRLIKKGLGIYPGCQENYLSLIFVADLVRGVLEATTAVRGLNETYFLCDGKPITWREIYKTIAEAQNRDIFEVNVPQPAVDFIGVVGDWYSKLVKRYLLVNSQKIALSKPPYWICSSEKARRDFGFCTNVSLDDGIKMTYQWYVLKGWL